jgi:hypothetical protein
MFFFVRQSFLFWNQISYFTGHVYSSLIVEMKSERYQFWKRSFENQAFLVKDPTHVIQCSPLIVLYFENKNRPVVRLKCHFPWFFVSTLNFDFGYILLMVCDEVTFFFNFKNKMLRLYQERLFLFLAFVLSICIITSSLIHEVTTLIEKLFQFWERHLSVQIAYLIEKGF